MRMRYADINYKRKFSSTAFRQQTANKPRQQKLLCVHCTSTSDAQKRLPHDTFRFCEADNTFGLSGRSTIPPSVCDKKRENS